MCNGMRICDENYGNIRKITYQIIIFLHLLTYEKFV